jgi:hypothetical protein
MLVNLWHTAWLDGQRDQEEDMICRQTRISVTLVVVVLWSAIGHAQASISSAEAKDHVG